MQTTPPRPLAHWLILQLWAGLLVFAITNVALFFGLVGFIENSTSTATDVLVALAVVLATLGLAALCWFRRRRVVAAGIIAGYALMSLVSTGVCTFLRSDTGSEETLGGLLGGAILYSTLLVGVLVAAGLAWLGETWRARRGR